MIRFVFILILLCCGMVNASLPPHRVQSISGGALNGFGLSYNYDGFGRRASMGLNTQPTALAFSYGYDNASRLVSVTNGGFSAAYSYLASSPLVSQVVFRENTTTRLTVSHLFDKLNRLQSISATPSGSGQLPLSFGGQYNDVNDCTRVNLPDGAYWIYQYDNLGQVTSGKKYFSDNTPVPGQQFEYAHDEIGNRTSTKAGGDQFGQNLRSATYSTNVLNQYTSRTVPGAFDVIGAAISTNGVTVNSTSAQYRRGEYFRHELAINNAGTNPAVTGVSVVSGASTVSGKMILAPTNQVFFHDADGNLTNDYVWKYTWDGENRLIQMVNVASPGMNATNRLQLNFEYDWRGRRIRKTVTRLDNSAVVLDNKFLYDGWNLIAELNGTNNNVIRSYAWGLDLSGSQQGAGGVGGLLMVKDVSRGTNFVAYDLNGNVMGLVNAATKRISAQYAYGPFGEVIRATGPMAKANPFRFSTKYQDDETDLVVYPFRIYSPSMGRWINRDPIAEDGGPNLYGYCGNDPINYLDPLGLAFDSNESIPGTSGSGLNSVHYPKLPGNDFEPANDSFGAVLPMLGCLYEFVIPSPVETCCQADAMFATAADASQPGYLRVSAVLTGTGVVILGVTEFAPGGKIVSQTIKRRLLSECEEKLIEKEIKKIAAEGGRLGSDLTRGHVADVAAEMESRGWKITGGGGKLPEEYMRGPNGRLGSSYPDITATKNGRTLRVNTVDTYANGITPTAREAANAARIRAQTPGDHLLLVPKP